MTALDEFRHLFGHLRSAADRAWYPPGTMGRAPNKPLLLLAVLDLFAEGAISGGQVVPGPDLVDTFNRYWNQVMPADKRPNMALPFYHLQNDGGFWHLVATPGNDQVLAHQKSIGAYSRLLDLVACARLDPALVACLSVPTEREALRDVLIRTYFSPAAQAALLMQGVVNVEAFEYSTALLGQRKIAESKPELVPAVRDQGFRRAVVKAYDYRCAMCGIRVLTAENHMVVEAAHIHAWSDSHNDHPTNGLALCRLCHWGFDEGMLSADRDRVILVSPQLRERSNLPGLLTQLERRPLIGPQDTRLQPDLEALDWHRRRVYQPR